jgi:methyl-accepting chemotaxis protein
MLRTLKTGSRLAAGFGFMLVLILAMEWNSLVKVRDIGKAASELFNLSFKGSNAVLEIKAQYNAIHLYEEELFGSLAPADINEVIKAIAEAEKILMANLIRVGEYFPGLKNSISTLEAADSEWDGLRVKEIEYISANKIVLAETLHRDKTVPIIAEVEKIVEELLKTALGRAESLEMKAVAIADQSLLFLRIFALVIVAVSAILAWILTRSIVKPLVVLTATAKKVTDGDLAVIFPADNSRDEIGVMSRSFAVMVGSFRSQAMELRDGVNLLASASSQISSTASELASSASETASSVSETTVTVEEVKQTAQVSMERAREVSGSSQRTLSVARSGEKTVESTAAGMQAIREQMEHIAGSILSLSEQSRAIGEIISSVDDIAEQSNLLSVNAAIEAAKAGEQGKGFAVVAREVKNLAEGSRQATRQVRTILGDIQKATGKAVMATEQGNKAVDSGIIQSGEVREALKSLAESIAESTQMAIQITAASQQQYAGVDQVTQAMENIREASRQNVDAARHLEDAARDIDALSRRLQETAGKYKL